jgi:tRNA threonylcarbamoyladenosine biosynthesis protein TsaE
MITVEIASLDQLGNAATTFLSHVKDFRIFAFYGPMGSGKTTFNKALCKALGATDVITSPTFSLVNEYRTDRGDILYHLDLYRITSLTELFDLGYEEYFHDHHYIFIEWAEKAESLLPPETVKVSLEEIPSHVRLVKIHI